MTRILFVCTANVCRSPFAQATLQNALANVEALSDLIIDSAGTQARPGDRMCRLAGSLLVDATIPDREFVLAHQARRLTRSSVEDADLILTAEVGHRSVASSLSPQSRGRIFTLREAANLAEATPVSRCADGDSAARLASWVAELDDTRSLGSPHERAIDRRGIFHRSDSRRHGASSDIPDGHPLRNKRHRETLDEVEDAVARLARFLAIVA